MQATITTERLVLRNFKESDANDMFATYCHDEDVTKYVTWYPHPNIEFTQKRLNDVILPAYQ